jgi:hypothetical protein
MKLFLLTLLIMCGVAFTATAQNQNASKLSVGLDLGVPTGQANQIFDFVAGGSLKFETPVSNAFNFTLTAGYSSFAVKSEYSGEIENGQYIPLEVGGKYYFNKMFYFEGDVGVSINVNSNYDGTRPAFIYAPALGVTLPTQNGNAFDLGLRYEGRAESGGTVSQVALRVAYRFNL